MTDLLLQTEGLTKRYGPVTVLDRVVFDVRGGEIHALLGANGAGKSTLCKIISGLIPASEGTMRINDLPFSPSNKQEAESSGVEIVQQELNLIPTLSVAENLFLSRLPSTCGWIQGKQLHRLARQALDRLGLDDIDPQEPVSLLGVGKQQMVEIAAALDRQCRLLILDEPTAALSGAETNRLFDWLAQLRRQGVGMIYISHRLDEVARIADRITVLRDGKQVCTKETSTVTTDQMVDLMSGEPKESTSVPPRSSSQRIRQEIGFSVKHLCVGWVDDVSFFVRRGERLGITGLVGSGRTELLRAIFGAEVADSGSVQIGSDSSPSVFRHPADAVAAGMAMVTEDRKQNGLLLTQSIRVNASLAALKSSLSRFHLIRGTAESAAVEQLRESMDIRCTSIDQITGSLSGGNQQKVVVAKWILRDADVFLFDEPTRGIDVSARARVYELMDTLSMAGKCIVMASSDLDELLETCDRIAVMSAGKMMATYDQKDFDAEVIMQSAFAGYSDRKSTATVSA